MIGARVGTESSSHGSSGRQFWSGHGRVTGQCVRRVVWLALWDRSTDDDCKLMLSHAVDRSRVIDWLIDWLGRDSGGMAPCVFPFYTDSPTHCPVTNWRCPWHPSLEGFGRPCIFRATNYISRKSWTTPNVLWSRASVSMCLSVRDCMPTLLHGPRCNLGKW